MATKASRKPKLKAPARRGGRGPVKCQYRGPGCDRRPGSPRWAPPRAFKALEKEIAKALRRPKRKKK
jgi:hypothetical protein